MYKQETGELQKVEIEIGTSRTSNGKEIRNSRFSNSKEIGTNRPSDGKALEAQSAFQNLLINKMINRCITDDRKQENIFPIKNSGLPEEYNPSHTVSTASIADDDDGPCHTTIEDHVILVEDSNRSIKEQIQEIKEKNWHKYNYACGNCTSAFPRMIDLIKHHNTCEREVTTFHAKKSKSQVESVDFVQNGTNMLPCFDWLKHKSKGESDVTCDINAMNSNSQVENVDIPQKGRKRKIEKKHPYSCSVCKTTFSTVNSLLQHKNECESDQFKKEEEKEDHKSEKMNTNYRHLITQFKLSKNVHFEIIKTGFGVVRCILCGEKNECFEDFSLHAKSKHFPYQCLVCPAFFANMDDLWQHSVACVYIKGQGYCCPVCRKILYSSKHLRVHCEENHTVYICFLCNSEFKDQKTLDLHRQTCS
ncbi:KRAB [Mytilus coruscus]|uniref:KRAB n=1 Tax=Mytilus coruscus TaxID=42192 RepID=A0A6J8A7Z4_MYTCO|nr:KRAB [Mytilus coruscus]